MDVKVDATMRWDGIVAVERKRGRRGVTFVGVVLPVVLVVALVAWFVRSSVVPPTISIPGPMMLAAAPPDSPAGVTDGQAPAVEPVVEAPSATAATVPEGESPVESSGTPAAPAMTLPMLQSLALAPPAASFGSAPAASATPQPSAAAPHIAAGVPLPPRRPRASAARAAGPVPLPIPRPQQ
jgi:hypothetical protein